MLYEACMESRADRVYDGKKPTKLGTEKHPAVVSVQTKARKKELEAVFDAGTTDDVLLIDDMRAFGKDPAYPEVEELRALLRAHRPRWRVVLEDDVLRAGAG